MGFGENLRNNDKPKKHVFKAFLTSLANVSNIRKLWTIKFPSCMSWVRFPSPAPISGFRAWPMARSIVEVTDHVG